MSKEVRCHANRGHEYAVNFNDLNEATHVKVRCYTSNVHSYWRMVWNLSHERMTTTAACAIRAAIAKASASSEDKHVG